MSISNERKLFAFEIGSFFELILSFPTLFSIFPCISYFFVIKCSHSYIST